MTVLIQVLLVAASLWAVRHVIRELRATFRTVPARYEPAGTHLPCATRECPNPAMRLVESTHPAGRITARCTRCADELEAKYERRTA